VPCGWATAVRADKRRPVAVLERDLANRGDHVYSVSVDLTSAAARSCDGIVSIS
jgi:mRNA-degrading endonuclease toxin of MazEF toxin-antitoxin module